jgi:DNA-binding response OmpR family regulator
VARILIVDDSEASLKLVARELENAGYASRSPRAEPRRSRSRAPSAPT